MLKTFQEMRTLQARPEARCGSRLVGGSRRFGGRRGAKAFAEDYRYGLDHRDGVDQGLGGILQRKRYGTHCRTAISARLALAMLVRRVVAGGTVIMLVNMMLVNMTCSGSRRGDDRFMLAAIRRMCHQRDRSMPNDSHCRDHHGRASNVAPCLA